VLVFNVRVGGISVHRLEDRQKVDMPCYWSELGGAVNLGHGTGIFCIIVQRFHLFHVFFIFFMTPCHFYFDNGFSLNPLQGLALCIEDAAP